MSGIALGFLVLVAAFFACYLNYLTKRSQVKLIFVCGFCSSANFILSIVSLFLNQTLPSPPLDGPISLQPVYTRLFFWILGMAYEERFISGLSLSSGDGAFLSFFAVDWIPGTTFLARHPWDQFDYFRRLCASLPPFLEDVLLPFRMLKIVLLVGSWSRWDHCLLFSCR